MNLDFLNNLEEWPSWKVLKEERISSHIPMYENSYRDLNSYTLVHVLVDQKGKPVKKKLYAHDEEAYFVFTNEKAAFRISRPHSWEEVQGKIWDNKKKPETFLKIMMLGEFVDSVKNEKIPAAIKVNPVKVNVAEGIEPLYLCEEVLFAPVFDKFTKKLLLTNPDDAKALLAIREEDEKRFGIEIVYYLMTSRELPEDMDEKEDILKSKLEEMAFVIPRVPMRRGSGSFIGILLNLENEFEETAFVRDYKTFDEFSDVVFVTSGLRLMTGNLEDIHYNGEKIDTIFTPLIEWQSRRHNWRDQRPWA